MAERVRITDVSPRDGLQNEPAVIPTAHKVALIRRLIAAGLDEVEVGSFVSPRWVPQLADGIEILAALAAGTAPAHAPPDAEALERARRERTRAAPAAAALDACLAAAEMKFAPDHALGPYTLDRFDPASRIAVELDGVGSPGDADRWFAAARAADLRARGVRLIRITEAMVRAPSEVAALIAWVQGGGALPDEDGVAVPQGGASAGPDRACTLSMLVPNQRGLQSVLDANARAGRPLVSKVAVFTAASETFTQRNINATIAESIERFAPVVALARRQRIAVRGYISCAIACPFEGPIAPAAVAAVARRLIDIGIDEVDLGDTIGAAAPESTAALLSAIDPLSPLSHQSAAPVPVTLHLHDTFGRAAECVRTALSMGVRSFDGAAGGLGGCPFATRPGGKRAPGNIATQMLVKTITAAGYQTGVDPEALREAGHYAINVVTEARLIAEAGAAATGSQGP